VAIRRIYTSAPRDTDTAKNGAGTLALNGASQTLMAANKDRVFAYVSNTAAANKMFVALGPIAALNTGIMVPPNTTIPIEGYTGQVTIFGTAADVAAFAEI
jgi:hypothetical protein